ncbi:MAG: 50S ribosomal protein L11 methyltransferase [Acidobacteriota bacterium]|nr:50S ribosomal protein L11 methyltransferase [Acidobacteriota bacterium]
MVNDLFSKSEVPSMCLRDVERTEAFRAAINKVVKPGDVVLDAGAGSGILSFFAAAAGARKVYSVEYDPGLAETLRRNAALNGFAEVIEVIAGDVRELRLPVQADVLIAELIETWLLDELQIPALNALRANRVIGAKTRIIPERYEAFATFGHVEFDCYGFRVPFPLHDWPDLDGDSGWQVLPFHAMTETVQVFDLRFNKYNDPNFQKTIRANALTEGTVNAVRLSGVTHLTHELTLGPTVAFNGNKVLPIDAVAVLAGEPISLSLSGNWGGGDWPVW